MKTIGFRGTLFWDQLFWRFVTVTIGTRTSFPCYQPFWDTNLGIVQWWFAMFFLPEIDCRSHMRSIPEDIQSVCNKSINQRLPGGYLSIFQHHVTGGRGEDERPPAQPSSLVMAPTRELVQQIAVEAKKLAPVVSARVLGIFGGVGKGARGLWADVWYMLKAKGGQDGIWGLRGSVAWKMMTIFLEGIDTKGVQLAPRILEKKTSSAPSDCCRWVQGFTPSLTGPQVSALKAGVDLLCATPGRLRDFMTGDKTKAPWDPGTAMSVLQNLRGYSIVRLQRLWNNCYISTGVDTNPSGDIQCR